MFKEWCDVNGVHYKHQFRIKGKGHPYDFIICGYDLLVEVDGDYWYNKEEQIIKDKDQEKFATENGFRIIRFLRSKIHDTKSKCFDIILDMI